MRFNVIHYPLALLLSLGAFGLSGCGGGGDGDSARVAQTVDASRNGVIRIALADTETDGYVHINGKLQFNLIGTNSGGEETNLNHKATWTLNDKSLGSIKNGLFTPSGKMGTGLVLNVSYAGLPTVTQDIILSDADLVGIELSHPTGSVDVCKDTLVTAKTVFSDSKNYDYPLTWAMADNASATLANFPDENKPELSTKKSGVVNVIAKGKNNSGATIGSNELPITIDDTLTTLTLSSDKNAEMRQGQTATLTATAVYRNSASANIIKNASLKSDNPGALSVNTTTGVITANSGSFDGTAVTVSVSCNNMEATLPITVTKPDIQKIEIVSKDSTTATETLSISIGNSIEPRIKVTYPTITGIDPEIYAGKNVLWEITETPTGYDSSKVTIDSQTGKVTIQSSMILDASINVTLSAKLLDKDNRVILGSDGTTALQDTIQLTINR